MGVNYFLCESVCTLKLVNTLNDVADEPVDMGRSAQDKCRTMLLLLWRARRVSGIV